MTSYVIYYYFLGRKSYFMLPHEAMAWAIAVSHWWSLGSGRLGAMPQKDKFRTHTKPSYINGVWQYGN